MKTYLAVPIGAKTEIPLATFPASSGDTSVSSMSPRGQLGQNHARIHGAYVRRDLPGGHDFHPLQVTRKLLVVKAVAVVTVLCAADRFTQLFRSFSVIRIVQVFILSPFTKG